MKKKILKTLIISAIVCCTIIVFSFSKIKTVSNNNNTVLIENEKPNILLIIADDLNSFVGVMDIYKMAKTPNLDALANKGSLFMNAHSNAPVCAPSRASLFSGIYPHHSGKFGFKNWRQNKVLANSKTIMEQLRDHGYVTAGVGKLTHNTWKPAWDEYGLKQDYTPIAFNGNKKVGHPSVPKPFQDLGPMDATFARLSDVPIIKPDGKNPGYSGWYSVPYKKQFRYVSEKDRDKLPDEKTIDWAIDKLNQWNDKTMDKPFFLGVGLIRPHTPLVVPDRFFDMFPIQDIELPELLENDQEDCHFEENHIPLKSKGRKHYDALIASYGNKEQALKTYYQAYLASIAFMDEQVGRLLNKLKDSKFDKNTIIVLTSDHGYTLGEKNNLFKNNLWESSTKVPLIIYNPKVRKKQVIYQAVSLIDLYPTICDWAKALGDNRKNEKGRKLDGKSMLPLLKGIQTKNNYAFTVVKPQKSNVPHYSLRTDNWRYIRYANGAEELYNHSNDPLEIKNVEKQNDLYNTKLLLREKLDSLITN